MNEESKTLIRKAIPYCCKCASRITKPLSGKEVKASELVGCKELNQTQWEDGFYADEGDILYQHNCPLMQKGTDDE